MTQYPRTDAILDVLKRLHEQGHDEVSAGEITSLLAESRANINRTLDKLIEEGHLIRVGRGPSTRYCLAHYKVHHQAESSATAFVSPVWSQQAQELKDQLSQPLGSRKPVSYQRAFVDDYVPNQSLLLPKDLAETLFQEGRMSGQQPAGTYARKVLEQLLIDLSWSSSRLEGNRYTLLATQELFKARQEGQSDLTDLDAVMLLNHKDAIEFMVDAVPNYGLSEPVIRNIHSVLMQNLLSDVESLGAIRNRVVNISDTTYFPTQVPSLLEEMLGIILDKARLIKNPVEAAFFLWVNLAYLQPFEDGNKRTSRLSANIPLMLYNCAPLSFQDVSPADYAMAMIGVYELLNITLAAELFTWTYRRSIQKYATVLEALGQPDVFRTRYRELLSSAVQQIVRENQPLLLVVTSLKVPEKDQHEFERMLRKELQHLETFNCARYRLSMGQVEKWIRQGRLVG